MEIFWNKILETDEEQVVSDYLDNKSDIVRHIDKILFSYNLFSLTFTHRTYRSSFFTYEFKKDSRMDNFYVFIWRGLRAGDTSPLIFGRIADEKITFDKIR